VQAEWIPAFAGMTGGAAGTSGRPALLRERHIKRGLSMNRNVTIGLGTLIIIIIVVALVF
jgi:hypothetical protein